MKTSISIPDELFEKAAELAERIGISRNKLYARAITEYAGRHSSQSIRERLDDVYAVHESELDPVLDRMQSTALRPEKW